MDTHVYDGKLLHGDGFKDINGKQGEWLYYDNNNKLMLKVWYKNDLMNGPYIGYHQNGKKYIDCFHVNGSMSGVYKEYYENGQIKEEGIYEGREYTPLNFWTINGKQLLCNGTGLKIEEFGSEGVDIIAFFFENKRFVREERLNMITYNKYIS